MCMFRVSHQKRASATSGVWLRIRVQDVKSAKQAKYAVSLTFPIKFPRRSVPILHLFCMENRCLQLFDKTNTTRIVVRKHAPNAAASILPPACRSDRQRLFSVDEEHSTFLRAPLAHKLFPSRANPSRAPLTYAPVVTVGCYERHLCLQLQQALPTPHSEFSVANRR